MSLGSLSSDSSDKLFRAMITALDAAQCNNSKIDETEKKERAIAIKFRMFDDAECCRQIGIRTDQYTRWSSPFFVFEPTWISERLHHAYFKPEEDDALRRAFGLINSAALSIFFSEKIPGRSIDKLRTLYILGLHALSNDNGPSKQVAFKWNSERLGNLTLWSINGSYYVHMAKLSSPKDPSERNAQEKRVYKVLNLTTNEVCTLTTMRALVESTREMRFPEEVEMTRCTSLLNPFQPLFTCLSIKGDEKIAGLRPYYPTSASRYFSSEAPATSHLKLLKCVTTALKFLHGKGYIHGNICLKHILCEAASHAEEGTTISNMILTHYALAKKIGGTEPAQIGKISHMPPELFKGKVIPDPSMDVYQLGITGLSMLGVDVENEKILNFKQRKKLAFSYFTHFIESEKLKFLDRYRQHSEINLLTNLFDFLVSCCQVDPSLRPTLEDVSVVLGDFFAATESAGVLETK